jgi:GAF domain-containing protein
MNVMIADASRFVSSLRTQSRFVDRALQACIPTLADFGAVFLVDGDRLRWAALAHATRAGRDLLRSLKRVYTLRRDDRDSTVAQVVRIGRPALRRRIRAEQPGAKAFAPARRLVLDLHRQLGARSALVVPIHGRDGVLGALALNYADSKREYTPENVPVVEHIAMQIGFALDREPLVNASPRPLVVRRRVPARPRARV